ncbi:MULTISPECIES: A/G-specific adenine glycosylase [unclassified Delftia]|uniref:A/G-specific adenine glycosylase n=1 Tax=unclassified Delftia TaxID=2613839 RepID=UPI0011507FCF|nr:MULTISPECIES: A/G-specific adenine glycosylase [unclassified Delftia]MCB4785234.1 A/G-specific adenine glycosylase [Delftia sp. Lp-1]TQL70987.1 A/G-specific DNA-adenine glycosylase [Delftia sp. HK171]
MTFPSIATPVVQWQASHGRNHLPWQQTRDPYRVWLSEIMLQQTQVSTVLGYYQRFLDAFPDVASLAAAPQDAVLALWSGLGYYSRARNLHRCAQAVVEDWGGAFPGRAEDLATLPGIGRSTAGAIASFCFSERVPILDANVRRVLTRVLAFDADLAVARNERELWDLAQQLCPTEDLQQAMPRYTQGLMDLGATICTPRKPSCLVCPLQPQCRAARFGNPENYPVRTRKLKRSSEAWWLLIAVDGQSRVWLERRPQQGIWAGLYAPPVFNGREALEQAAAQHWPGTEPLDWTDLPAFLHVLTHRDLHLHPVRVRVQGGGIDAATPDGQGCWADAGAWADMGLPAPVRKLLDAQFAG